MDPVVTHGDSFGLLGSECVVRHTDSVFAVGNNWSWGLKMSVRTALSLAAATSFI